MKRDQLVRFLRSLGACSEPGEAVPWAESLPEETTAAEAWALCSRGDWLVWLIGSFYCRDLLSRQTLVLAACAVARTALGEVPAGEDRPRIAIETAEGWVRGDKSKLQLQTAFFDSLRAVEDRSYSFSYATQAAFYAISAAERLQFAKAHADSAAIASLRSSRGFHQGAEMEEKRCQEIADAVRAVVPWATVEAAVSCVCEEISS